MTGTIDVSVVLAVRNAEATIAAAIRSMLAQSHGGFELIVVDDGSTDGSLTRVEELGDSRVRILVNDRGTGLAASLNRGVLAATGRYIARMDADDLAFPDRLEQQVRYLKDRPEVDLLGASALVFTDAGEAVGILRGRDCHADICRSGRLGFFPMFHPTWMGKAEWFRRFRYDESFDRAQDFELLLRAARQSTYANHPDILLAYRRASGSDLRKRLAARRNVWRAMHRHLATIRDAPLLVTGGLVTAAKAARDVLLTLPFPARADEPGHRFSLTAREADRWAALWADFGVLPAVSTHAQ